ncbi:MAG: tail fiber domain-containing protein [Bacteroidales bacterium]
MKKLATILIMLISLLMGNISKAQNLGIGPDTFDPEASAGVEMRFTDKGLLIPRVALTSTSSASPITSPATSLLIYNTATAGDVTPGYYYWNGSAWVRFATGSSVINGSGTATRVAFWSGANTLSSNANLYWDNTNSRLGIGTSSPSYDLHVQRTGGASSAKIGYSSSYTDNRLFFGDGNYVYVGEYNTDDRLYLRGGSLTIDINGSTGTSGQVLTSNGTTCSWTTPSSGGVTMGCATNNYLTKRSSATSLACSNVYDNGTTVQIGSTSLTNSKLGILNDALDKHALYISSCGTAIKASGTCGGFNGIEGDGNIAGVFGYNSQKGTSGPSGRLGYNESGTTFYGVYGYYNSSHYGYIGSSKYGVYGRATSTNGDAGVYGYNGSGAWGALGYYTGGNVYAGYFSGNGAYTGSWTSVSDEKFKKNISDYNNALDNIMKLRPVTYEMKTEEYPFMNFEKGTQIGFIAQEMEPIFPSLVVSGAHPGENENDPFIEYKGINYIGLTPILVKAIQEQQIKIDDLKSKYESLQKRLEEIESILESLQ